MAPGIHLVVMDIGVSHLSGHLDTMGHMSSETFLKNYKNNRVDEESEEYLILLQSDN